jgi:DNA replication protein DnaC
MAKQSRPAPETSIAQQEKTTTNLFNYDKAIQWLEASGKKKYGIRFVLADQDLPVIRKLLAYFLRDQVTCELYGLDLNKGILLSGPIGCGKTALMTLLRYVQQSESRYIMRSCRDLSFEFIEHGYKTIQKYSSLSFKNYEPINYCFDDLGTEKNLKFFGNECNIMAELILSRYDEFINRKLLTHITTNLSASEIEAAYGNRVRSRMREMLNLISFDTNTGDKRK